MAKRMNNDRKKKRRPKRMMFTRRARCKFCLKDAKKPSYLDFQNMRRFTTERGKILPSRITGCCAKHQRQLAQAIKRARQVGVMPFLAD